MQLGVNSSVAKDFTPASAKPSESSTMIGRKEKRSQQRIEVMLSSGGQPVFAELASMENVNSYGVRVRTERPWKPDTRVLIKSSAAEWVSARVIYCQTMSPKSFAVGLEFATPEAEPALPR